jgi:hypothetical protein
VSTQRKRRESNTAVLVVHGMGTQRPLATLRGIVDAVWLDDGDDTRKRVWLHPELSGADIDLPVITSNAVPQEGLPKVDFHEFYWSHLMSETRAVAVLLWLFELARKGPRLNPGIGALWWGSAIFLAFLILSVTYLVLQGIEWSAGVSDNRALLLLAPVGLVVIVTIFAALVFAAESALKLARATAAIGLGAAILLGFFFYLHGQGLLQDFATVFVAVFIAAFAVRVLMGWWGIGAFALACLLSLGFYLLLVSLGFTKNPGVQDLQLVPWSLGSQWSVVLAWLNVAAYLIFNVMFLQPYLGDAARYFRNAPANTAVRREIRRQAVDMLSFLHTSGKYDRIIIVAHSLGSVIAYDMLRAYFARVAHDLPTGPRIFDQTFNTVDSSESDIDPVLLRTNARELVRKIAHISENAHEHDAAKDSEPKTWLVTDFVSLGSPLTHAYYLMCDGDTTAALQKDFQRRVREREFPTCPPRRNDDDGRLTFIRPGTSQRLIHHGALFGLTRWTNLYFPASNLFWGDAIGGAVGPVFGKAIKDIPIYVRKSGIADFFSHVTYWDIGREGGRNAPHIQALRDAINLADRP